MARIRLKDFGPISDASVEINPLTVLTGPNNSGKSYLALVIYCAYTMLSPRPIYFSSRRRSVSINLGSGLLSLYGSLFTDSSTGLEDRIKHAISKVLEESEGRVDKPIKIGQLPGDLQKALLQRHKSAGQKLAGEFAESLQSCFGTQIRDLVRRPDGKLFEINLSSSTGFSWTARSTENDEMQTLEWPSELDEEEITVVPDGPIFGPLTEADPDHVFYNILMQTASKIVKAFGADHAHYMAASRSGIMLAHKAFAGILVRRSSRAWIDPLAVPRLSGVVTDMISDILNLQHRPYEDPEINEIVEFLQSQVTHGDVRAEPLDEQEYPEIYYHQHEVGTFPLHLTSSMVSEIAPLVVFLKHIVNKGELLIIEEPESHLDPVNQTVLARAIARLVNVGVRVLITTHSDFFIQQLNNLLLLSSFSESQLNEMDYSSNEALDPSLVGAYSFQRGSSVLNGSTVEELQVTAEEGIPISIFTDAHSALYDAAVDLDRVRQKDE